MALLKLSAEPLRYWEPPANFREPARADIPRISAPDRQAFNLDLIDILQRACAIGAAQNIADAPDVGIKAGLASEVTSVCNAIIVF